MAGRKSKHKKYLSSYSEKDPLCVGQLQLFIGAKIEALDSSKWYQARVVKINEAAFKVLVHFDGWNSRHDKWFHFESDSLRPLSMSEESLSENSSKKELCPGDRVLARWSDSKFYPAKVCSAIKEGTYEVVFYDGFKKYLSKSNIRPDRKRTFETFEEKFKGITPPNLPSCLEVLSPVTDDATTPSSSRVKRRHAEPSTMADFVTCMPGKRPRKHFTGDAGESFDKSADQETDDLQYRDSDAECKGLGTKSDKRKRYSSPCESISSASSCPSTSKPSPSERPLSKSTTKESSKERHSRFSPERDFSSETMFEEDIHKEEKYPQIKPIKKRKAPCSFLKIKLPLRSPGSKMKSKKKDAVTSEASAGIHSYAAHGDKDAEMGVSGVSKDGSEGSGKILKEAAREVPGRSSESNMHDIQHSLEKKSAGTEESFGLDSSTYEREFIDDSIVDEATATKRNENKLDRSANTIGAAVENRSRTSSISEESTKRLPRRERKLTEKGLELKQRIVLKKRTEAYTSETDDIGYVRQFDAPKEETPFEDMARKREDESNDSLADKSEIVYDSGEEIATKYEKNQERCNIKLVSERKLKREVSKCDLEASLAEGDSRSEISKDKGTKVLGSGVCLDKVVFVAETVGDTSTIIEKHEDNLRKSLIENRFQIDQSEKDSALKNNEQDDQQKSSAKSILAESHANKSAFDGFDEDRYSDADSEGSLVIDMDDDVKDDDSNSSFLVNEASPKSTESRTKVKQRTYPKLKYTLSHEERRGNRMPKKTKAKKQTIKHEKKEVLVEMAKKDQKSKEPVVASPLMSLTKLVADRIKGDNEDPTSIPNPVDEVKLGDQPAFPVDVKTEPKQPKSGKQTRGPNKSRARMKDQFLSMVTQDRPSQIERPISKDLVNEKLLKGKPRNRSLYWSHLNASGLNEGNREQESKLTAPHEAADFNKPLEFSQPCSNDGRQQDSIRLQQPSSLSPIEIKQSLSDEKISKNKPKRKPKTERRSTPDVSESYGLSCYYPYNAPHFVTPMDRQISPVTGERYAGVEPRYASSPYSIEQASIGPLKVCSPSSEMSYLSGSPNWVPQEGMYQEPYVCEVPGLPPPYPSASGTAVARMSPNLSHHASPLPMQFAPGIPSFYRPPVHVHPKTPFSAKISNCPCEECRRYNHHVHASHDKHGKLPPRPEYSTGKRSQLGPTEQSHDSNGITATPGLEPSSEISAGPSYDQQESRKDEDPPFIITDVYSLRDSGSNSKVTKSGNSSVAVIDSVSSKEDSLTRTIKPEESLPQDETPEPLNEPQTASSAVVSKDSASSSMPQADIQSDSLESDKKDDQTDESLLTDSSSPPPAKGTTFLTKKKRLDFITGKLSAQKKGHSEPNDADMQDMSPPDSVSDSNQEQYSKEVPQPMFVARTPPLNTDSGFQNPHLIYPRSSSSISPNIALSTSFSPEIIRRENRSDGSIPVDPAMPQYPHPEARLMVGPPMSFQTGHPLPVPPEDHIILGYPHSVTPPFSSHHGMLPLQPLMDPAGIVASGFRGPLPHRMAYPPPDVQNQTQFFQTVDGKNVMQRFPYGPPPRHTVPPPGYFHPRGPRGIPLPALPPYDARLMMPGQHTRFVPITPNGRAPVVVCKQPNCSCPLPHAAQPLPLMPQPAPAPPLEQTKTEEEMSKEKTTPTVTQAAPQTEPTTESKNQSIMKGDPRRLTQPLQRLKKVGANAHSKSTAKGGKQGPPKKNDTDEKNHQSSAIRERSTDGKFLANDLPKKFDFDQATNIPDAAEDEGKENMPTDATAKKGETSCTTPHAEEPDGMPISKRSEKSHDKEHVYAPKEFVVELNLDEYKCDVKNCGKSFRKSTSLDYHTRYFHSPRVPQRKRNTSSTSHMMSPDLVAGMLPSSAACSPGNPQPPSFKKQGAFSGAESAEIRASTEDLTSIRSGYASSVITEDNLSDREKHESSDESDETDVESDATVSVDDIIRCKCADFEEQGFMIQCEQCLTWQHGDCVQLTIDTVPKKYVCYQCSNPQGLRRSFKYKNNFDWYKRGTLPSLVPTSDQYEDKIANITQASHALMEDIANVMDVLEGIKKKLALLDTPLHPSLRIWRRKNEKPATVLENKDTHLPSDALKQVGSITDSGLIDSDKAIKPDETPEDKNTPNNWDEQLKRRIFTKTESAEEKTSTVTDLPRCKDALDNRDSGLESSDPGLESNDPGLESSDPGLKSNDQSLKTNDPGLQSDNQSFKSNDPGLQSNAPGLVNDDPGLKLNDPGLESNNPDKKFNDLGPKPVDRSKPEDVKNHDLNVNSFLETEKIEAEFAKVNLLDHVESIEEELSVRMDEIEKNLDFLEDEYKKIGEENNEHAPKSAFKIALPDMTSLAKHVRMINSQLLDAC